MTNNIDLDQSPTLTDADRAGVFAFLCAVLNCDEIDLQSEVLELHASNRALTLARDENSDVVLKLRDEKFALEKRIRELTP